MSWSGVKPLSSMQFTGQVATQMPQPWQTVSMMWLFSVPSRSSCFSGALKGHTSMHFQHETHRFWSTMAICGLVLSLSLASRPSTFAAVPEACATAVGMSLGDWQAPARKMPAVLVSTGRSFGCDSL